MCLRDKVHFLVRDMDRDFIQRTLKRSRSPKAVWLYGYGEPLVLPHIFQIIREIKSLGTVTCLSTNGTLLTETAAQQLLDSKLDYLIVAFDGATAKTYEKYRKGASFARVKDNVERFIELKLARRSRMHLTLQMILMNDTRNEVSAFKQLWTRPGVDCVRVREDLLKHEAGRIPAKVFTGHRPCFFLWRGPLFIQAAGTVIPCPYYHGSTPFGEVASNSADEAWNSSSMQELRKAHVSGDLSKFPICAACPRYQPHALLAAASFFVATRSIRRLIPLAERIQQKLGWRLFE
jgi:radical SAM protein with 4Fe4S-binding SPASM domain